MTKPISSFVSLNASHVPWHDDIGWFYEVRPEDEINDRLAQPSATRLAKKDDKHRVRPRTQVLPLMAEWPSWQPLLKFTIQFAHALEGGPDPNQIQ
jgi:hypothetical protein